MPDFLIGTPTEWADFSSRNAAFVQAHEGLRNAITEAFRVDLDESSSLTNRIVYFLGRGCVDDFEEIVILAGNGRGFGALKLLRGMYERYVHARHLQANPRDASAFWDYSRVQEHRLLEEIKRAFGAEIFERPEFTDGYQNAQAEYKRVKDTFLVRCCSNCDARRINHSWHKLDVVSMAAKLGGGAAAMTVSAYYRPMKQVHSTVGAIIARMVPSAAALSYGGGVSRSESDKALAAAHLLLLGGSCAASGSFWAQRGRRTRCALP
jgi:hypothetical protein